MIREKQRGPASLGKGLGGLRGTNLELTGQIGERLVPQRADRTVLVGAVLRVEHGRSGCHRDQGDRESANPGPEHECSQCSKAPDSRQGVSPSLLKRFVGKVALFRPHETAASKGRSSDRLFRHETTQPERILDFTMGLPGGVADSVVPQNRGHVRAQVTSVVRLKEMTFQLRHVSMPGMPRVAASFTLSDEERKVLLQWSRGRRAADGRNREGRAGPGAPGDGPAWRGRSRGHP